MREPIQIFTRDELVRSAPARWQAQYASYRGWDISGKAQITNRLLMLKDNEITAERVREIVGNNSWTSLNCEECGEDVLAVAQLVNDSEWGGKKVSICLPCLRRAVAALEAAHSPSDIELEHKAREEQCP